MRKLKLGALVVFVALWGPKPAYAWNPISDIQQQTKWDLGQSVAIGTAYKPKYDTFSESAFAEIADYRFLSAWYGTPDAVNKTDAFKLGLNVGYFFAGFANQPPAIIKNLVVGPALGTSVFTSPHTLDFYIDLNYRFGGS